MSSACICHIDPKNCWWCMYEMTEEENKRYRRELENALYFIKHSRHESDKARIMQESIEKLLEGK